MPTASATVTRHELAKMIDHSLLHPTMSDAEIAAGCAIARHYDVATVCVKPYAIEAALGLLAGSDVGVCAVIGFPHGNSTTAVKVIEAEFAAQAGAREIDMVINIGKAIGGDWDYVSRDIKLVNEVVVGHDAILKVIFENDYLANEQIVRLCDICTEIGVAFIKTSTGYGFVKQPDGTYATHGATVPHLQLMRRSTPSRIQIKAAGGVRTLDQLLLVRSLGVTRIGATATATILDEAAARGDPLPLPQGVPAPKSARPADY